MGREVRKVPENWQHPKREDGSYIALFDGSYDDAVNDWDERCSAWNRGDFPEYADEEDRCMSYAEWAGERPRPEKYMPAFLDSECTHYMMYETTTEGTPISPAFATAEELAKWLADTGASAFGYQTANYEQWLRVAKGGYACSAVMRDGRIDSGVAALTEESK